MLEKKQNLKAFLYLLPSLIFLGVFMLYPLVDVLIYSVEENFNTVTQQYTGIGFYNFIYIFNNKFFLDAVKNTFLIVFITVPLSTLIALAVAVALNSIKPLRNLFETIFFLPYVTNTLAVGLVFMIMFKQTDEVNRSHYRRLY